MLVDGKVVDKFQSTLPVGEATPAARGLQGQGRISIHASRGGSDYDRPGGANAGSEFQSTLPVGEATSISDNKAYEISDFNPRFPWGKRPAYML